MRLTYDAKTQKLLFQQDEGSHSCGESRYDWRTLGTMDAQKFVVDFERMLKNPGAFVVYIPE